MVIIGLYVRNRDHPAFGRWLHSHTGSLTRATVASWSIRWPGINSKQSIEPGTSCIKHRRESRVCKLVPNYILLLQCYAWMRHMWGTSISSALSSSRRRYPSTESPLGERCLYYVRLHFGFRALPSYRSCQGDFASLCEFGYAWVINRTLSSSEFLSQSIWEQRRKWSHQSHRSTLVEPIYSKTSEVDAAVQGIVLCMLNWQGASRGTPWSKSWERRLWRRRDGKLAKRSWWVIWICVENGSAHTQ